MAFEAGFGGFEHRHSLTRKGKKHSVNSGSEKNRLSNFSRLMRGTERKATQTDRLALRQVRWGRPFNGSTAWRFCNQCELGLTAREYRGAGM